MLTTYNGQRQLLEEIVRQRCSGPQFGPPASISTVDKFQGQQNDFILLSLVRTESVGHLRDVRRLIVAMSRSRLGLYVFGRADNFKNCFQLKPVFDLLCARPLTLRLVPGERFEDDCTPSVDRKRSSGADVPDVKAMGVLVYQMTLKSASTQP